MAVGALALTSAGCSDIVSGLGGYNNIEGSYDLRTFNGYSLPAVSYQDSFQQHYLLDETFTIYSDGTYTDDYTVRIYSANGAQTTQNYRDVGTWQQNGSAIQFRDQDTGDIFNGSITGGTLTVSQLGDVYVYQR